MWDKESEREEKSRSICVWCEAGSVFSSVLRYFGIILLDDTLAQTHGEDHSEELEENGVVSLVIRVETDMWSEEKDMAFIQI